MYTGRPDRERSSGEDPDVGLASFLVIHLLLAGLGLHNEQQARRRWFHFDAFIDR
jgi:hypothetical protein